MWVVVLEVERGLVTRDVDLRTCTSLECASGDSSSGAADPTSSTSASKLPDFWETRQRERDLQAKQMGVFSRPPSKLPPTTTPEPKVGSGDTENEAQSSSPSSELALVQIATHTLETMAKALEHKNSVQIPMAERAAFAEAMKHAMSALAKQSA